MIINKTTKQILSRSDMPSSNWLDEEWCVVSDFSPLASKINVFFPYFDIVFNEFGEVVDVVAIEKTKAQLKQERITEIEAELEEMDKTTGINRVIENIITYTGIYALMPDTTKEIIKNKKALREERKSLIGGMTNAEDNTNQ